MQFKMNQTVITNIVAHEAKMIHVFVLKDVKRESESLSSADKTTCPPCLFIRVGVL